MKLARLWLIFSPSFGPIVVADTHAIALHYFLYKNADRRHEFLFGVRPHIAKRLPHFICLTRSHDGQVLRGQFLLPHSTVRCRCRGPRSAGRPRFFCASSRVSCLHQLFASAVCISWLSLSISLFLSHSVSLALALSLPLSLSVCLSLSLSLSLSRNARAKVQAPKLLQLPYLLCPHLASFCKYSISWCGESTMTPSSDLRRTGLWPLPGKHGFWYIKCHTAE